MKLVFDTSALSALLLDDDSTVNILANYSFDQIILPLAVDAELRYGFEYGTKKNENLRKYQLLVNDFGLKVMNPDQETSIIYADLATWLRKKGIALSNNDIWIAATSIQYGASLFTMDKDFQNIPQVRLVSI